MGGNPPGALASTSHKRCDRRHVASIERRLSKPVIDKCGRKSCVPAAAEWHHVPLLVAPRRAHMLILKD